MSEELFKQIAAQTQAPHDVLLADLSLAVSLLGQRVDNNIARYLQIITLTIQALERNQAIDKREKAELYKRLTEKTIRRNVADLVKQNPQAPRIKIKNPLVDAVKYHSVTEPKVVKREPKPKQVPSSPWPFPTQPKPPAKPTTPLPKVHVLIRKHPAGNQQPLGERRVYRMEQIPGTTQVQVGIGEDGKQGWILDTKFPGPHWLTFRVDGSKTPSTFQEALQYWQSNK